MDFHLLNNKNLTQLAWDTTFSYHNNTGFNVQVALFYEEELESEYDYHSKVPYYTTILKKRKRYDLPINKGKKIYLYTFDQNGKLIDSKLISSATNG